MKQRDGFRVPPSHKPPSVEVLLGKAVEMMMLQSAQIECLKRCVGKEKFDAELAVMAATPPENPGMSTGAQTTHRPCDCGLRHGGGQSGDVVPPNTLLGTCRGHEGHPDHTRIPHPRNPTCEAWSEWDGRCLHLHTSNSGGVDTCVGCGEQWIARYSGTP